jgi:hypothetical protein
MISRILRKHFIHISFLLIWLALSEGLLYAMPPVQRMVLPNQLVLLVCEEHSLPFVTFQLLINSGSRQDSSGEFEPVGQYHQ